MSSLRIELLGGLRLLRGNESLTRFNSQKVAALLAFLAYFPDREHARDALVDLLWPDADLDAGRVRLRTVLTQLRELLDTSAPSPLDATRISLRLRSNAVATDVTEFRRELQKAEACEEGAARAELLEAALRLYKGELLPGMYEEWVLRERDRLSELRRKALFLLAQAHEGQGSLPRAIETMRTLVADDPLREEAHCELMRLHLAAGQPAAALLQYSALERALRSELDVEPCAAARVLATEARGERTDDGRRLTDGGLSSLTPTPLPPKGEGLTGQPRSSVEGLQSEHKLPLAFAEGGPGGEGARPVTRDRRDTWSIRRLSLAAALLVAAFIGLVAWRNLDRPRPQASGAAPASPVPGGEIWRVRYQKEGESHSDPQAIVANGDGSLIVAGFVRTPTTDVDYLTAKYDRDGRLIWSERYNGPGNDVDRARSVSVDSDGSVYVLGDSDNGRGNEVTNLSGLDLALVKYRRDGERAWERRWNGPDNGEEWAIQVLADGAGGVYVLGNSLGRNGNAAGPTRYVLLKYDGDGKPVWTRRGLAPGGATAAGMAVAPSGAVVVAGFHSVRAGADADAFVDCYGPAGKRLWSRELGRGNGEADYARAITRDPASGRLYIAGTGRIGKPGRTPARSTWFVAALDEQGAELYRSSSDADASRLRALFGITVAPHGHVYLLGDHVLADGLPGYRLVKLDPAGGVEWVRERGHTMASPAVGGGVVLSDVSAGVYVTCIDCTSVSRTGSTREDYLTRKLDAAGVLRWERANDYAGKPDSPRAMAFDPADGIVVAGQTQDAAERPEMELVKYRR